VSFGSLNTAGLNIVPPSPFLLGLGTLVFGAWPRRISTVVYGNLTWSVLLEFIGAVTHANRWLLDTSVCFHMVLAPATSLDWISAAIISGLGMAAAAIGGVLLNQRDVLGVHNPPSPRARRTGEPGAPTC